MTKFEEEFKALTSWEWINIDLIQRILTRFGNWHSDEEFQELLEQNAELTRENNIVNQINSKLESQIIGLKSQLQQQALPVVPKFVGEWYEEHKNDLESSIYRLCIEFNQKVVNTLKTKTKLENWLDYTENKPIETLIRMQDGYTVEKPQLFYIELPNVYGLKNKVSVSKVENGTIVEFSNGKNYALKLTEQEIKSIDERYWQFAMPVEDGE
ncbi:hypothetical protein LMG9449_2198 [Lactococcus lactis subsp. lactis]|uniref:DUF1642 domain-containing protein n=1 Tax=Lactococcus lactis subsp. lactis TaxID=1360 RepID=A0A0V8DQM3_LACLL|nr:DUF1642 domain-containing protein [Lactococcus lactis]KSU15712.1 hypothetical protein LMG9449_2198 [Lactococcus lactis subsp. lactis]